MAIEVIIGAIVLITEVLELILAIFAAIDFKSLEKAQWLIILFKFNY